MGRRWTQEKIFEEIITKIFQKYEKSQTHRYMKLNKYQKKHKLESRLPGEISITSDMQMTPPLWQKVKRN